MNTDGFQGMELSLLAAGEPDDDVPPLAAEADDEDAGYDDLPPFPGFGLGA